MDRSSPIRGGADPVYADAAQWWARLRQAPGDAALRAAFETWVAAEPSRRESFAAVERGWDIAAEVAAHPAVLEMRRRALAERAPKRAFAWPVAAGFAIAAIGLSLAGAVLVTSKQPTRETPGALPAPQTAMAAARLSATYQTRRRERRAVVLEDGSVLSLRGESVAVTAFSPARRMVTLQRGEATFEVAKDPLRPFIVSAGGRLITAHGTVFRINLVDERLSVALLEGSVSVSAEQGSQAVEWLRPGQELVAMRNRPAEICNASSTRPQPTMRRLVFDNQPLGAVAAEANRHSRVKILVEEPAAADLPTSGVFTAGQQQNIAETLADLHGLILERTVDGNLHLRPSS